MCSPPDKFNITLISYIISYVFRILFYIFWTPSQSTTDPWGSAEPPLLEFLIYTNFMFDR